MTDQPTWSSAGAVRNGLAVIAVCLGGLVLWSVTAQLHGAVLAGGAVEVVSGGQVVQHPDGGIVGSILVRNGDRVRAGQEVLRLDGSELREQHAALSRRLFETRLAMARLHSEHLGARTLTLDDWIVQTASGDADLTRRIAEERAHFDATQAGLAGRDAQLAGRLGSAEATLQGLTRQHGVLTEALDFATTHLTERRALLNRGLERASAVAASAQQALDLEAQVAALEARMAELEGSMADITAEREGLVTDQRQTALTDHRAHATEEAELLSQLRLIDGRLSRLTLRAPRQGVVHDLQVTTEGGVIAAGQDVMTIVPDDDPMILSVRVAPEQIDSVYPGQISIISFPGLDARTGQEIEATVLRVSPDVIEDPASGQRYYEVDLTIPQDTGASMQELALIPGMPVLAQIQTESRTPAAYLMRPLSNFFRSALGEA